MRGLWIQLNFEKEERKTWYLSFPFLKSKLKQKRLDSTKTHNGHNNKPDLELFPIYKCSLHIYVTKGRQFVRDDVES